MMNFINREQIIGIARIVVVAVCTWLAAKGWSAFGDEGIQAQLGAAFVGLIAVAYSFYDHTTASKLKKAAAVDPGIEITVPASLSASNAAVRDVVHDNVKYPNITAG